MQTQTTQPTHHPAANALQATAALEAERQREPQYGVTEVPLPDPNSARFAHGLAVAVPAAFVIWVLLGVLIWSLMR